MDAGSPSHLTRQVSMRSVVDAIRRAGSVSRAELARITGLSKQTMSEVIRALEDDGWARGAGQTKGPLGRSATTYELVADAAHVLGVDLGGTKIHAAIGDLLGDVVAEAVEPTDKRGGRHVVDQIGAIAERLAADADLPHAVRCATVGSPGVFDPRTGRIASAPNIPGFDELDVGAALGARLGCSVLVENDVNLAAIGEQREGCCVEAQTFAFIAFGTGIGMGVIANGAPLRGRRGAAGEIAYLPIGGDPFDPRLQRLGVLESAIGSAAILDRYRGFGGAQADDVRAVFDRLAAGDKAAEITLDDIARHLLQALMAISAVIDPEKIVLGGSIGVRQELLIRVRALAERYMPDAPPIEISALGARAALIGAIGASLSTLYDRSFGAVVAR